MLTLKLALDSKVEMSSDPLVVSLKFKGVFKDGDFHFNHQIFCVSFGVVELDGIIPFSDSQPCHTFNSLREVSNKIRMPPSPIPRPIQSESL